ncbi:MAG TPA: response regulator [Ignavibacteria bacterium]|nr:response regulator [Ignavibacteria bacterium]
MNTKTKILIVEDEKLVGMDVRENLHDMGFFVTALVDNSEKAIESIKLLKPDIVIMDIIINGNMDGIETADIIRKDYGIPVIFTSANNDDYTLLKAKKVQPYSFLVKPVNPRELFIAVEIAVYKSNMEEELRQSKEWFEMTLKSISDGIITVNNKGIVTFINQSAQILTGWSREEALGRDLIDILKFKDFENNYDGNSVNEFGEIKYLSAQSLVNKKTLEVTRVQTNDSIIRDIEGNHAGMVIILRKSKIEEQLGISNLSLLKA